MFQCIQYPFDLLIPQNWHKSFEKFPKSEMEVQNAVDYLLKLKNRDEFILKSIEEIKLWQEYFKNPEYLSVNFNPCKSEEYLI